MYEQLVKQLEEFLANYNKDLSNVEYCDENGYTKHDAIFDAILFNDFCQHLRKANKFDLWIDFNDDMDKDVESKEYDRATETWNMLCDMVDKKVEAYL